MYCWIHLFYYQLEYELYAFFWTKTGDISVAFTGTGDIHAAASKIESASKTGLSIEDGLFTGCSSMC